MTGTGTFDSWFGAAPAHLGSLNQSANPPSGSTNTPVPTPVNNPPINSTSNAFTPSSSGLLYDVSKGILSPVNAVADTTAQSLAKTGQGVHALLGETAGGISDIGTTGIAGLGKGTGQALADIGTGAGQGVTNAAKGAIPAAIIAVVIILAIGLAKKV